MSIFPQVWRNINIKLCVVVPCERSYKIEMICYCKLLFNFFGIILGEIDGKIYSIITKKHLHFMNATTISENVKKTLKLSFFVSSTIQLF